MADRNFGGKFVEIELNVPSGKIIIVNDCRRLYPVNDDKFDINQILGIKQTVEAYGKVGLLHAFVGNSCPGVYAKDNKITIACAKYDEKSDDGKPSKSWGKRAGGVCTDLWWFCAADYKDFKKRGGKKDKSWDAVITVEPGRYVMKYRLGSSGHDDDGIPFATIERSDKKLKAWKMPEEGMQDALYALLPKDLEGAKDKPYISVEPEYKQIKEGVYDRKNYKFVGYKIWGHLGESTEVELAGQKFKLPHYFNVKVTEKQLANPEKIIKRMLTHYTKRAEVYAKKARGEKLTNAEYDILYKDLP